MSFYRGPSKVKLTSGKSRFYERYVATNLYVERAFVSGLNTITISNDSETDDVQISFDGATLDGELSPGDNITLRVADQTGVYIKGTAGGDEVRIWGW